MLAATMIATLAVVLTFGLAAPIADADDEEAEQPGADDAMRPASQGGRRQRIGSAAADRPGRSVQREAAEVAWLPDDEVNAAPLRLPGQLPPLHDPAREAAARADRALQRDIERARDEAIDIGNRMATDLEQFVAELQALPRAEQRIHARNVHAHFDWQSADRLAVLRAKLPEAERSALQVVTYKRIEPLIWRLDAMAAED